MESIRITWADIEQLFKENPHVKLQADNIALRRHVEELNRHIEQMVRHENGVTEVDVLEEIP